MGAFEAQDGLYTTISDTEALDDWTIDLGIPTRRDERHIWVHDDITAWSMDDTVTGQVRQNEDFTLQVWIYSRKLDATYEEQRDEVGAALEAVKATILADPTLAGTVSRARPASAEFMGAFEDAEGRVRFGVLRLDINCRIWA